MAKLIVQFVADGDDDTPMWVAEIFDPTMISEIYTTITRQDLYRMSQLQQPLVTRMDPV